MRQSHEPTVSLSLLRGLAAAVERSGASRAELLQAAAIHTGELSSPHGSLLRARFERACEVAIALTGDRALGLNWAAYLLPRSFGPIAEELSHAATLRQALEVLARFERFFTDTTFHSVIEGPIDASVRIAGSPDRPVAVRRLLAELSSAWFVKLIRTLHPEAELTQIAYPFEAPSYADAYAAVLGAPVRFGHEFTELTFARFWLDAPRHAPAAPAHEAGGGQGERAESLAPTSQRLHRLFIQRLPARLTMRDAARALELGERTLRRRLAAEGRTFKEVELGALAELAKQLLHEEQLTIQETAFEMGFSGPNAFHRAFKRWTGVSPSNFQGRPSTLR